MQNSDFDARRSSLERLRTAQERATLRGLRDRFRRNRKRPGGEAGETVPVEPHRPNDLSGGAAAALAFDD